MKTDPAFRRHFERTGTFSDFKNMHDILNDTIRPEMEPDEHTVRSASLVWKSRMIYIIGHFQEFLRMHELRSTEVQQVFEKCTAWAYVFCYAARNLEDTQHESSLYMQKTGYCTSQMIVANVSSNGVGKVWRASFVIDSHKDDD